MSHTDIIYDSDPHFTISPITRQIKNESSSKTTLVQGDHKSERFSFEMPRIIEGHDMSECNRIEIHYINSGISGESHKGIYDATDMHIHPDDSENVVFSWLLWDCVTKYEGKLAFAIRFACVKNDIVEYEWNTIPNDKIKISKGIDNSGETTEDEEIPDLIAQWKETLFTEHNEMKAQIAEFDDRVNGFDEAKLDKSAVVTNKSSVTDENSETTVPSNKMLFAEFVGNNRIARNADEITDEYQQVPSIEFAKDLVADSDAIKQTNQAVQNLGSNTDEAIQALENKITGVAEEVHILADEVTNGVWGSIAETGTRVDAIEQEVFQAPMTAITSPLVANKEYGLGFVGNLTLTLPTNAKDGDVVFVSFISDDPATTLNITNNNVYSGFDLVPEPYTGYEIYGKYKAEIDLWMLSYSEYPLGGAAGVAEVVE